MALIKGKKRIVNIKKLVKFINIKRMRILLLFLFTKIKNVIAEKNEHNKLKI